MHVQMMLYVPISVMRKLAMPLPTKAPGPDGFPACFFQRNWCTFKEDIVNAVKNFFKDGIMPEGVNDTAIVLTPKIKKIQSL